MDQFNLLDLDDDILNIIGDYVKKDNERRINKEEDFESTNYIIGELIYNLKIYKFTTEKIGEKIYSKFNLIYDSEKKFRNI